MVMNAANIDVGASELINYALKNGSNDNITILILDLK